MGEVVRSEFKKAMNNKMHQSSSKHETPLVSVSYLIYLLLCTNLL